MLYPTKFSLLYIDLLILNYMLATCLKPVRTEATKDWECYGMLKKCLIGLSMNGGVGVLKSLRLYQRGWGEVHHVRAKKSPAVKEQSFSVHMGALGISPSTAHYIIKRLWKSAEMCWALIPQAELHLKLTWFCGGYYYMCLGHVGVVSKHSSSLHPQTTLQGKVQILEQQLQETQLTSLGPKVSFDLKGPQHFIKISLEWKRTLHIVKKKKPASLMYEGVSVPMAYVTSHLWWHT